MELTDLSGLFDALRLGWRIARISYASGAWVLVKGRDEFYFPIPQGWALPERTF